MKKSEHIRILLIGAGGYGSNYLNELTENIVTSAELAGICEVMPGAYERYKCIPVYQTPMAFFREQKADLAVISSPIHLHFEQVKTCLMGGANVLCEKPVSTSVQGAEELIELERQTGKFVSIGYQLNYSGDVLELKQDILSGRFGKPLLMKAFHGMRRGDRYYNRNNWAGRIMVNGCRVNDSPFNNACAHQFQNMTFLLGKAMDMAMDIKEVQAELYRANREVENYDTAAVCAVMENGIPIYYYTTHNLAERKWGPICEYQFEEGTVYFGRDFGDGPVNEYVAVFNDGTIKNYGEISKGHRLQKLYDAIASTRQGSHPVCTIQCAIPHLEAVEKLAELPVWLVRDDCLEQINEDGEQFCCIRDAGRLLKTCYSNQKLPSELGINWKI